MDTKQCTRCLDVLPVSEFHRHKGRKDGLNSTCKACNVRHMREWVQANRERMRSYLREYRLAHIEEARAYGREHSKRRYEANKEIYRRYCFERRSRKRANTKARPSFRAVMQRMQECGGTCVYCGGPFEDIEHVLAVSRGGSDDLWNLVPACAECNASKSTIDWRDWFRRHRAYSPGREQAIESMTTRPASP